MYGRLGRILTRPRSLRRNLRSSIGEISQLHERGALTEIEVALKTALAVSVPSVL